MSGRKVRSEAMGVLTESSILARARVGDLAQCTKLNVWGCNLTDISIVKQCRNLQVLSASCNDIVTLKDILGCGNLQELYVRENQIDDLQEVVQLKCLPKLRVLWLAGNPCCNVFGGDDERYRLWVLSQLPHLDRLDNSEIRTEERKRIQDVDPSEFLPEVSAVPYSAIPSASASPSRNAASASGDARGSPSQEAVFTRRNGGSATTVNTPSEPQSPGLVRLPDANQFNGGNGGNSVIVNSAFDLSRNSSRSGVSDMSRPSHLQSHPSVAVAPVQMSHPSNPQQHYKHHPETTHSFPTSSTSSFHGSSMQPAEQFHRVTGRGQVMYTNSDRRQMVVEPSVVYDESPGPATAATAHRFETSAGTTQSRLRNINILSATLNLVKELDSESLQILQLDINHRLEDIQARNTRPHDGRRE